MEEDQHRDGGRDFELEEGEYGDRGEQEQELQNTNHPYK